MLSVYSHLVDNVATGLSDRCVEAALPPGHDVFMHIYEALIGAC